MQRTFRLFISSPFSDFTKEREVLHTIVFPKISEYCEKKQLSFQPIDLRWGVSVEAQLDQKTLEVCLEEVRACKHFPHPNFLIMAGDRYGYVPCPYMIEENEFNSIKNYYKDDKNKIILKYPEIKKKDIDKVVSCKEQRNVTKLELLEQWYQIDQNQIYIKEDQLKSTARILQLRADDYVYYDNWKVEEDTLREILQEAANQIFEDKSEINKEYRKYFTSATEAEVLEGIYDYKYKTETQKEYHYEEDKKYIYGYLRKINEIGDNENEQKYLDRNKDGKPISELKEEADKFKSNLSQTLITENIVPFEVATFSSVDAYEKAELEEFAVFLIDKLKTVIDKQSEKSDTTTPLKKEKSEQAKFQQEKLKGFQGREIILGKIKTYINKPKQQPLVIHGVSGMGKSALMAKAIEKRVSYDKNKQEHGSIDDHGVIYRFVGATEQSTTIRNLLTSICDELQNIGFIGEIEEYKKDDNEFYEQIKEVLSSINESTILFIDALDQLQHKEYLKWLPEELPKEVKIILSVLNDAKYEKDTHYYNLLERRVDKEHLIDIKDDSLASTKDSLVKALLEKEKRKLDDKQTKKLLDKWKETSYSPLYLKIAIEEVKHWKHGDQSQTLASNVEDVILEYMENLHAIYHHETILIDKVLGYIHASKDGLSEKELLDILSEDLEDAEIFQKEIINEYHDPIKVENPRRGNKEELVLPMSVWSRLHTQLKPFIIERIIDGQPLMKFFHRQFATVIDNYINQKKFHLKLEKYYRRESFDKMIIEEDVIEKKIQNYLFHLRASKQYLKMDNLLLMLRDRLLQAFNLSSDNELLLSLYSNYSSSSQEVIELRDISQTVNQYFQIENNLYTLTIKNMPDNEELFKKELVKCVDFFGKEKFFISFEYENVFMMLDDCIRNNDSIDLEKLGIKALIMLHNGYISNSIEIWPKESVKSYIDERIYIKEFRDTFFVKEDDIWQLTYDFKFEESSFSYEEEEEFISNLFFLLNFFCRDQFKATGETFDEDIDSYLDESFFEGKEESIGSFYIDLLHNIYTTMLHDSSYEGFSDYLYGKLEERECDTCNILRTRQQLDVDYENETTYEQMKWGDYQDWNPGKTCMLCEYENNENLFDSEYEDYMDGKWGPLPDRLRYRQDPDWEELYDYSMNKLRGLGFLV